MKLLTVFLVGAFINKKARLLQSLVFFLFLRQTRSDEIFVQFVQLNEYLGNASKLSQRDPFKFLLFKRNMQNRMRLKGPLFNFFGAETFFRKIFLSSKRPPFDFIEVPLVISRS